MEAAGTRYVQHASRADVFALWNLSDLHVGNVGCDLDGIKRDVKRIAADPYSLWVGGGDYAEYISPRDKRFDPASFDPGLRVRDMGNLGTMFAARVRDLFAPIAGKCLGLAYGNHEASYQTANDQDGLHGWLCTELGAANLGYSALLDIVFVRMGKGAPVLHRGNPKRHGDRNGFRVYVHHGAGAAGTPGGKLNRLVQFMDSFDADVYMIGHVHDRVGKRITRLGADASCRKIVERERVGVVAGSYLKTYAQGATGYGERKGYRPTSLGPALVHIRPTTREITAEV